MRRANLPGEIDQADGIWPSQDGPIASANTASVCRITSTPTPPLPAANNSSRHQKCGRAQIAGPPQGGGNRRSVRISGLPDHSPQRPRPTVRWYAGPVPSLRRGRCRPAMGQEQHCVPPLPLPGRRRQDHPRTQVVYTHLPLFQRPVYISHSHHHTPRNCRNHSPRPLPNLPDVSAYFTLALV